MAKMRIRELAQELEIKPKDIIEFLSTKGIEGKSAASNIEDADIDSVRKQFGGTEKNKPEIKENQAPAPKPADKSKDTPGNMPKEEKTAEVKPKKKNIHAVFNSQYSSGRGEKRRGPIRPREGAQSGDGRRPVDSGHRIVKPRLEPQRPRPVIEPRITPKAPVNRANALKEERVNPPVAENKEQVVKPEAAPMPVKEVISTPPEKAKEAVKEKYKDKNKNQTNVNESQRDNKQKGQDGGKKRKGNNQQNEAGGPKKKERLINLEKQTAKKRQKPQEAKTVQRGEDEILNLVLPERLTIKELAEKMQIAPSEVIKTLFMKGKMVTLNQSITYEQAEEIALEFNCICEMEEKVDVIADLLKEDEENEENMVKRPPVVCVMGHVDHGKTSLLDAIRDTHMIDREAGGITQKIGAYMVSINGEKITFLDTPGHEAFTAMRMRGANSTDIAILVVAADDGVMPQTVEAINHARAAGVEIIVAINKIDKPGANIDRVKKELAEHELVSEDWGGSTVFVPVSAHTHEGIDELLEMVLLTAEVLELKADKKRNARGLVIEAELDKGRGVVATVLVQKGTLKVGDPVVAGRAYGKVRAMLDEHGRRIKKAGPSTPAEILGLSEVPNAGEIFLKMDTEKEARAFAETYISVGKDKLIEDSRVKMSLDDLFTHIKEGELKELNLIIKADVQGSVEALRQSLEKLSDDEVIVKIIHSGVGAVTESDVTLASTSKAIIIGFNVRVDNIASQRADEEGVDIRLYKVIYNILDDIEAAMKGMLAPVYEEKIIGHAMVRQIFKASDVGAIAGSYVTDGIIQKGCKVRIRRREELIHEGELASLKRFKDNVKEVKSGFECGLVFEGYSDFAVDDEIEAYIMVEVPRK